jgi:hypothetical protein
MMLARWAWSAGQCVLDDLGVIAVVGADSLFEQVGHNTTPLRNVDGFS